MNNGAWPTAAKPSRVKRLGVLLALVVVGLATSAGPAQADDTQCFFMETGVHDNIVVPDVCLIEAAYVKGNIICEPGSLCFVSLMTTVRGNVLCEENAACFVDDSTVFGNVQCDRCSELDLGTSEVRGSVQSTSSTAGSSLYEMEIGGDVQFEGTGQFLNLSDSTVGGDVQVGKTLLTALPVVLLQGLHITNNDIDGDMQMVEATAAEHEIVDNGVGGNLQFFKNRGASDISRNTIAANLQCKENKPPPMGSSNTAKQKEGQCRLL